MLEKTCTNPDCKRPTRVLRKGLCNTCSQRVRRNGSLDYRDPESMIGRALRPGEIKNVDHPLYVFWNSAKRRNPMVDEWHTFQNFIKDISNRPSDKHELHRLDKNKPFGPDNWCWREPVNLPSVYDFSTVEGRSAYSKDYRKLKQYDRARRYKTKYGITIEQYDEMFKSQKGRCYISGREVPLGVDHDHKTGAVRKLLGQNCNSILGQADDSVELLAKCIMYLAEHSDNHKSKIEEAVKILTSE